MAKFSGKNIEFKDGQKAIFGTDDDSAIYWDDTNTELTITTVVSGVDPTEDGHLVTKRYLDDNVKDHGDLTGLGDDDHPRYVPRDGSRGFTGTVSGTYPTETYHLITYQFMEDVLLGNTPSGIDIPQIGNVLFGSEFYYAVDETISSTNATTYQEKLSLTVSGVPSGNYRLGMHYEWRISKNNVLAYIRLQQDNTIDLCEMIRPTWNDVNICNAVDNFFYLSSLTSGTHTFDIDFCSENSGSTVYINNTRLEFWRVS